MTKHRALVVGSMYKMLLLRFATGAQP